MVYRPEPAHAHGRRSRVAVVLCNLGTPEAPRPAEVRRYLAQFLSDPRVVELPRALWLTLLHGVILRTRPARSAAKYASIWQKEGSPLLIWTRRQAQLLQGWMGHQGHDVIVTHAMRYGQPALDDVLDHLKTEGVERVLILPAYPQYAASTTASLLDALGSWVQQTR
ncbi:MAG: ferrochelatase, partial [Brachymonas sp.]